MLFGLSPCSRSVADAVVRRSPHPQKMQYATAIRAMARKAVDSAMRFFGTLPSEYSSSYATSFSPVLPAKARIAANLTSGQSVLEVCSATRSYYHPALHHSQTAVTCLEHTHLIALSVPRLSCHFLRSICRFFESVLLTLSRYGELRDYGVSLGVTHADRRSSCGGLGRYDREHMEPSMCCHIGSLSRMRTVIDLRRY